MWYFIGGAAAGLVVGFAMSEARIFLVTVKKFVEKQKKRRKVEEIVHNAMSSHKDKAQKVYTEKDVAVAKSMVEDIAGALHALGYPLKISKRVAIKTMINDHPNTVEEGVVLALNYQPSEEEKK